jgi:prepilin peptidase CpaA
VVAILTIAAVTLVLAASLHDLAARTIPNGLVVMLAFTGASIGVATGNAVSSLAAGTVVFVVAVFCWRKGWLGGGDVKLLGAAALAVSPGSVPLFVAAVAIGGGILAGIYLVLGPIVPDPGSAKPARLLARAARAELWRLRRRGPLPYACAIAGAFLFVVL